MGGMNDPLQEARRLSDLLVQHGSWESVARALVQRVEDAEAQNKKLDDALDAAKQMLAYWQRECQAARQALRQEEERP